MKLSDYILEKRGNATRLAAELGFGISYLSQIASGVREASPQLAASIERGTSGKVTCEELLPAIAWTRVKDKSWPHPSGRPLHDVARAMEAA